MKTLILSISLCLCACSAQVSTLSNSTNDFICGWDYDKEFILPPSERCWLFQPGEHVAAAPWGSDACDAKYWTTSTIWHPGDKISLWNKGGYDKQISVYSKFTEIDCH